MAKPIDFSKYKTISFDVFDTLVSRLVASPSDVFLLVEERAKARGIFADGFYAKRISAEKAARASGAPEITMDDIYSQKLLVESYADLKSLREIESEVELDVCVRNPTGGNLYSHAVSSGLQIVITSDMYLDTALIEKILVSCGYAGWSYLFVSSREQATKAAGSLFESLTSKLGVRPNDVLHIGDNWKSDIVNARRAGLRAYHVSPLTGKTDCDFSKSVLSSMLSLNPFDSRSLVGLGYECLGPVLVGFANWLKIQLDSHPVNKVLYFARDGLVISDAVQAMGLCMPDHSYFYASRRALQVPSFGLLESFDEIVESMFLPRQISISTLFRKIGLDRATIESKLTDDDIDLDLLRNSDSLASDPQVLAAFHEVESAFRENATHELDLLISYLKQENVRGDIAIVDIGWFGNMQVALERVLKSAGIEATINGYYVGLMPSGKPQHTHNMRGYLFDAARGSSLANSERNFNLIFETVFSALHGTTRGYCSQDGRIVPVLAPYVGAEAEIGKQAQHMRDGALIFCETWRKVFNGSPFEVSPEDAIARFARVGNRPNIDEAVMFGDWGMEADGSIKYAAKPKPLFQYLKHPKALPTDFNNSAWKIGFLKRLFVLPLPYGRIWDAIHSCYGRMKDV